MKKKENKFVTTAGYIWLVFAILCSTAGALCLKVQNPVICLIDSQNGWLDILPFVFMSTYTAKRKPKDRTLSGLTLIGLLASLSHVGIVTRTIYATVRHLHMPPTVAFEGRYVLQCISEIAFLMTIIRLSALILSSHNIRYKERPYVLITIIVGLLYILSSLGENFSIPAALYKACTISGALAFGLSVLTIAIAFCKSNKKDLNQTGPFKTICAFMLVLIVAVEPVNLLGQNLLVLLEGFKDILLAMVITGAAQASD